MSREDELRESLYRKIRELTQKHAPLKTKELEIYKHRNKHYMTGEYDDVYHEVLQKLKTL